MKNIGNIKGKKKKCRESPEGGEKKALHEQRNRGKGVACCYKKRVLSSFERGEGIRHLDKGK